MRCCAGDGGGPSGTALQGEVPNPRRLLRSRAVVVSVAEKARETRQVGAGKANESEPLMKCRKRSDGIETGVQSLPRDESGGSLLTGQVVPGTKAARARLRRQHRTWEPVAPAALARCWADRPKGDPQAAEIARGRVPQRGTGLPRHRIIASRSR